MPRRLQGENGAPYPFGRQAGWGISPHGLTAHGQAELLKHLGRQLQDDYQKMLKEPAPDRIKQLLERLEESRDPWEEDDTSRYDL